VAGERNRQSHWIQGDCWNLTKQEAASGECGLASIAVSTIQPRLAYNFGDKEGGGQAYAFFPFLSSFFLLFSIYCLYLPENLLLFFLTKDRPGLGQALPHLNQTNQRYLYLVIRREQVDLQSGRLQQDPKRPHYLVPLANCYLSPSRT
jgi:hypothetical protein